MTSAPAPLIPLLHGAAIPQLGLGTFPLNDQESEAAVAAAIELGYRSFDTAENYGNEVGVGRGLRAGGVPREELFVTTKFNKAWHGVDLVADAFEASAARLGVDYVDLLLIHWPNPAQDRYVDAVSGLAKLLEAGKVRAIGTSNFKPAHLQRVIDETGVVPDVNQIQLHPGLARREAREFHARHGIVTESWAPLGGQWDDILVEPLVVRMAERYERTPAQVVLRWHMDLGLVTVPKTSHPARMAENLALFDFHLEPADLEALGALDKGEEAAFDSDRGGH
jgi:2,5-diketo-D-gluconate reductase A